MNLVFGTAAVLAGLVVIGLVTALVLIATPEPPISEPKDVFNFTSLRKAPTEIDPPSLRRYPARDGEQLVYRIYESASDRILIFIHGSSYHGGGYHALASAISLGGTAKVVLPNLRGHYQSGRRRGDVDYVGQLEDDLDDLIMFLRTSERRHGPITLGGHSSGGGLAIRFAGGVHAADVSSYLLLAPIIPLSKAVKGGDAGGWASLHWKRLYGLLALNAVGIHGFNGLPIVAFNKPAKYWDGTETLTYSYRLNASYHPRTNYHADIHALPERTLVFVGANDEAIDADALRSLFAADAPQAQLKILPDTSHFGIFSDPAALAVANDWLKGLPDTHGP
jgi:alpha-beta hydrolase superfamily lysophospholipase